MSDTKNIVTKVILIACACFILAVLVIQFHKKQKHFNTVSEEESIIRENYDNYDSYYDDSGEKNNSDEINNEKNMEAKTEKKQSQVMPSEPVSNEDLKAVDFDTKVTQPVQCFPKDKLTAEDLLPKDAANSRWAEVNPAGQGDVADKNYLSAGHHLGIDTIGQSLRNPNYQLRSDPPNPKLSVGPWNQSTIEYDQGRRHFEINEC